ncbi:MAG TPA: terminase [Syntrophaceae bacterium]|nr:terminase [Syntrophaceae bacterium]
MPSRSKITKLPDVIKRELDKRLITGSFSDYRKLSDWLQEQGFEISRSAINRYGQAFEDRLAAIKVASEQARAVSEAVGDNEGVMNDALISLVQEKAFDVLVNLQTSDPVAFAKIFPKMGIMVAKLSKASVDQKKWMSEAKGKAKDAAEEVVKAVKKSGMSEKTAEEIRKKILGIV